MLERKSSSTPSVPELSSDSYPLPLSKCGLQAYSILYSEDAPVAVNPLITPTEQFTKADRDRVLELMFSDPAVVQQLCARRSPQRGKGLPVAGLSQDPAQQPIGHAVVAVDPPEE